MKLIIFILIVLIIAALLIRIILRSVNQHSPLLMQLHAAGIRTGDAERILSSGEYWQRQKTLLTEREVSFMRGLTLSGTKTHVKQRFLPLTPLLMVSDVLWSPVLPA